MSGGDHDENPARVGQEPDLSEKESQELIHRIGRGVRAMVGDVLLDPLPPTFKRLLDQLEGSEKARSRA